METAVLDVRRTMLARQHAFPSVPARDPVCRCGHGQSVHPAQADPKAGTCAACEDTKMRGLVTPSGGCCDGFEA